MVASHMRVRGFTLLEALVSIVILGILAAMVAVFIRPPIDAYLATSARAALTEEADGAIRRIAREVQSALPNSFRAPSNSSGSNNACFEFLPVIAGGRYRVETDGNGDTNDLKLDFTQSVSAFDVLAYYGLDNLSGTNYVVIYNLGGGGADAYATTPAQNRAQMVLPVTKPAPGGAVAQIKLASAIKFPYQSPGKRFQVIGDSSVIYSCSGNTLYRATRLVSSASSPLSSCPTTGDVVLANVDCSNSFFTYTLTNTTREGEVEIMLTLNAPSNYGTIRLYDRVSVNNVP